MNFKTLIILFSITLIIFVVAIFSVINEPEYIETKAGDPVLPELISNIDNIGKMVIRTNEKVMTIKRHNKEWSMDESDGYSVRPSRVKSAILGFAGLQYFDVKTKKEENYAKLDLRNPSVKESRGRAVKIFDQKGEKLADIVMGKSRYNLPGSATGGIYFRVLGDPQVWLAVGQPEIGRSAGDWLIPEIINIASKRIKEVSFSHSDGEVVGIIKQLNNVGFKLVGLAENQKLRYSGDLENIAAVLENLELEDVRKKDSINFNGKSNVAAKFSTVDGLEIDILMVKIAGENKKEDNYWITISANSIMDEMQKEADAIMQNVSPWIFKIPAYKASRLNKRMSDLVEAKEPAS